MAKLVSKYRNRARWCFSYPGLFVACACPWRIFSWLHVTTLWHSYSNQWHTYFNSGGSHDITFPFIISSSRSAYCDHSIRARIVILGKGTSGAQLQETQLCCKSDIIPAQLPLHRGWCYTLTLQYALRTLRRSNCLRLSLTYTVFYYVFKNCAH